MEVVGPQFPLSATATFRVAGEGIGEHSCQHRLVLARSTVTPGCPSRRAQGIETIIRLCLRLELAFTVKVISSNIHFLVEAPDVGFDDTRMMNEFGSDGASTPERWDRVGGMPEVGVGKAYVGE